MQVAYGLYGHQPMKMPWFEPWNESLGEAHTLLHKNCHYPNRRSSKYFTTVSGIHGASGGSHIRLQTIVSYGCISANDYINTLHMSSFYIIFPEEMKHFLPVRLRPKIKTVTPALAIILMVSANVGIRSAVFGLESSGTIWRPPLCHLTGWLLNDTSVL
jgi:hypothetical protein